MVNLIAEKELVKHKEQIVLINNFSQIAIEFCEFGMENVEIDVPQIFQTLTHYSEEEWNSFFSCEWKGHS